ncbi:MAG: DNA polymerase III subunit alpha [Elusimicrobia bacterium CG06_land_8_20_14_3_00_38_11]|nr:MAG: DNA polymerase III subunit alpha [Elusimicrobia bacterium CG06_land_8_20_14_3_00_38_11]
MSPTRKQAQFVHLHNHTEYSFLDGACRILDDKGHPAALLKTMEDFGLPALAITDHGNMCGAIEFYNGCLKSGIKPIIGLETYLAEKSHKNKLHNEKNYHLTLLAKDETGYKNLTKLSSIAYLDGFYYKPRIDKELLQKYSEGLVVMSGCLHGEIAALLLQDKYDDAKKTADFYKQIFPADFYIELMENGIPEQTSANGKLLTLAKEMSIPVVATNDCHYLKKEDAEAHEVLLCIGTASTLSDPKHLKFRTDQFYYKSPEEMQHSFKEIPDAIKNTLVISEKCNLTMDFSKLYLPDYKVPDGFTLDTYLGKLCDEGLKKKYERITDEIKNRLEHELKIISDAGYSGYFLIVWDFIKFAKSEHIPVGPGRGSGAGSIVSYLLGITEVDPLKYGLLFERFLNPSRLTMPDLDIDFADDGRDKVIDYVRNKYGADRVSHIITFNSMLAKGVVRDVGRVLSVPLDAVNKLAALIPKQLGITLSQSLSIVPELKSLYQKDEKIKKLIDVALKLEGLKRQPGVHAAGIVIAKDEITNYVPLAKGRADIVTTQYEGKLLEKMGLLKMDFLGLRTLAVIRDTVELIKKRYKLKFEIENIPLDDKKAFQLLSDAKVAGVFQVEKSGMRDLLKKLKPKNISDITAIISLYRPGPMGSGMLDEFVARYHGKTKFKYEHPLMEKILSETHGIIVYQEQVMKIATDLVGLSLSEADIFRWAMSKKNSEFIEKYREVFLDGAKKKGLTKTAAEKIFNNIKSFGEYGFNKSHATAYGFLTYRTAYLKANYPLEFFTALLSSEIGHTNAGKEEENKIVSYIKDAQAFAIGIFPPDINRSFEKFTIEGEANEKMRGLGRVSTRPSKPDASHHIVAHPSGWVSEANKKGIRFGLVAVKNVGEGAVESIIHEREKSGNYKSINDFIARVDFHSVNKKVLESLCKAGAFDIILPKRGIMPARDTFVENVEQIIAANSKRPAENVQNQPLLFDLPASQKNDVDTLSVPIEKQWHEHQLLANEKEVLGFYLSGHPLAKHSNEMKIYAKTGISDIKQNPTETVRVTGIVANLRRLISKKKEQYARFKLEDLDDEIDVLVFPKLFNGLVKDTLKMDEMVVVAGRLNMDAEPPEIIADEVVTFKEARKKLVRLISINISEVALEKQMLEKLKDFLKPHRGIARVEFSVADHTGKNTTKVMTDLEIEPSDAVISGIEKILGKGVVNFS